MKWYTYISMSLVLFLGLSLIFQIDADLISICFLVLGSMTPIISEDLCSRSFEESHTLLLLIPFSLIGIINWKWVFAIGTGYISHLIIDTISYDKPPVFYPISKKRFSALNAKRKIEEGSSREKSLFIVLLAICFILLMPSINLGGIYEFKIDYSQDSQTTNETQTNNNSIYYNKVNEQVDLDVQVYGEQEKKVTIDDGKGNVTTIKVENMPKNTT